MNKSLDEISEIIKSKNYFFDISVNGSVLVKKQTVTRAESLSGSLIAYLKRLSDENKQPLVISLFSPNGSSYLNRGIFFAITSPVDFTVDKPANTVDLSTKPANNAASAVEPINKKMDIQYQIAEVENRFLKEKIETNQRFFEQQIRELKDRLTKTEKENTDLFSENRKLLTENATLAQKHELDYKSKVLELEKSRKQGFSGIMDDIKTAPPEMWQFIAGMLPNHPMNKLSDGKTADNQQQGISGITHENAEAKEFIEEVVKMLSKVSVESVSQITMLVDVFVTKPDYLVAVFEKIFPSNPPNPPKQ